MRRIILIVAGLALLLVGCSASTSGLSDQSSIEAVKLAQGFGFRVSRTTTSFDSTLPLDIDQDSRWSLIQVANVNGGFDLRPYAGQQVNVQGYALSRPPLVSAASFWTIRAAGKIVGAYISEEEGTPGIYGLNEGRGRFADASPLLWILAGVVVAALVVVVVAVRLRRTARTSAST